MKVSGLHESGRLLSNPQAGTDCASAFPKLARSARFRLQRDKFRHPAAGLRSINEGSFGADKLALITMTYPGKEVSPKWNRKIC
jgi:hypothetical protein